MLDYLFNTTAIWLIGLILFHLLLSKEPLHTFNRAYLLAVLLAGILLPAISIPIAKTVHLSNNYIPILSLKTLNGQPVLNNTAHAAHFSASRVMLFIYILGVLFFLVLQANEVIRIVKWYRSATKTTFPDHILVVTDKMHPPFSCWNFIFVSSLQNYSSGEWEMILQHELRHKALWHVLDVILLQVVRVIFWFHPLAYIIQNRILQVHEYQADMQQPGNQKTYAHFLVQQTMLHSTPLFVHSFHRSPIKNRIVMLTQKKSGLSLAKTCMVIPIMIVFMACFTKNAPPATFVKNGNQVTYKGNIFQMTTARYDTVFITDPVTGKEGMKVQVNSAKPLKMNDRKVYVSFDIDHKPSFTDKNQTFSKYFFDPISKNLDDLPDGTYYLKIYNIVIGPNGELAYYDFDGFDNPTATLDSNKKKMINQKIQQLINDFPKMLPAQVEGVDIPCLMCDEGYKIVTVKDHKASYGS